MGHRVHAASSRRHRPRIVQRRLGKAQAFEVGGRQALEEVEALLGADGHLAAAGVAVGALHLDVALLGLQRRGQDDAHLVRAPRLHLEVGAVERDAAAILAEPAAAHRRLERAVGRGLQRVHHRVRVGCRADDVQLPVGRARPGQSVRPLDASQDARSQLLGAVVREQPREQGARARHHRSRHGRSIHVDVRRDVADKRHVVEKEVQVHPVVERSERALQFERELVPVDFVPLVFWNGNPERKRDGAASAEAFRRQVDPAAVDAVHADAQQTAHIALLGVRDAGIEGQALQVVDGLVRRREALLDRALFRREHDGRLLPRLRLLDGHKHALAWGVAHNLRDLRPRNRRLRIAGRLEREHPVLGFEIVERHRQLRIVPINYPLALRSRGQDVRARSRQIGGRGAVIGEGSQPALSIDGVHGNGPVGGGAGRKVQRLVEVGGIVSRCADRQHAVRSVQIVHHLGQQRTLTRAHPRIVRRDQVHPGLRRLLHIRVRPEHSRREKAAAFIGDAQRHDLRVRSHAGNAFAVVDGGRDDAGHMRAVAVIVHRVVVAHAVVVAMLALQADVTRILPHDVLQVGIGAIHARVDHGHHHFFLPLPRPAGNALVTPQGFDVGGAGDLVRGGEVPLEADQRVVRRGGIRGQGGSRLFDRLRLGLQVVDITHVVGLGRQHARRIGQIAQQILGGLRSGLDEDHLLGRWHRASERHIGFGPGFGLGVEGVQVAGRPASPVGRIGAHRSEVVVHVRQHATRNVVARL